MKDELELQEPFHNGMVADIALDLGEWRLDHELDNTSTDNTRLVPVGVGGESCK